jgi:MFS family permease
MLFASFTSILGYSMLQPFLPLLARKLDPTGVLVGFAISSYFLARTFIELPSGLIADRIDERIPIILGLCISTVASLICAFSRSIYVLILGLVLWGLGEAFFLTTSTALIIGLFEPHMRGRALGIFLGIGFIGNFAGAPIGGFLAEWFGYTFVFCTSGASMTIGLMMLLSRDLKQETSTRVSMYIPVRETLNKLRSCGLLVICLASASRMIIMQGIFSTIFPIYLYDFLKMRVELIGVIMGVRIGGLCLATAWCGYISDKVGRKPIIFAGILIESFCLCLYTLASTIELLLLLAFIGGLGAGMITIALLTLASEQSEHEGSAVGLYRTFLDLGAVIGPILIEIVQIQFNIHACFFFGAILLLANIPTLLLVKTS